MDRKQAEMVAAQIALENLRQRYQLQKTENEMLKVEVFFNLFFLFFVLHIVFVHIFALVYFKLLDFAVLIACRWKI